MIDATTYDMVAACNLQLALTNAPFKIHHFAPNRYELHRLSETGQFIGTYGPTMDQHTVRAFARHILCQLEQRSNDVVFQP